MGCWGLVIYAMTAATCSGNKRPAVARSTGMHLRLNCGLTNDFASAFPAAILQKYLDNFDLSIKIIYILGTLAFSIGIDRNTVRESRRKKTRDKPRTNSLSCLPSTGTAIMAIFPNVYVAMVMISSMGIISMSISYCPYALLGQYHEIKEVLTHVCVP